MTPVQPAVKRKRNRTAREEALVADASKLFASRGYVSSTTREIAAAAGVVEGLLNSTQSRSLPAQELEALAHFISITSFMFGFMRPAFLHQDREKAKKMAIMMAQMMVRNFEAISTPDDSQPHPPKPVLLFT